MRRVALIAAAVLAAGCGSNTSSPTIPPPATIAQPTEAAASVRPAMPTAAASAPEASLASAIPIESGLLDLLPGRLDGLDRQTDPSVDAGIAGNAELARLARSFATAIYVDPTSGQFAYVSLVRLNQALSDAAYRDYRDSFDDAACSQAGGRTGTATSGIAGRDVEIGHCAGGLLTYHLRLDGPIVVSISSLGDRRLGEKLVAGLGNPGPS